jgi:hypothetical protein
MSDKKKEENQYEDTLNTDLSFDHLLRAAASTKPIPNKVKETIRIVDDPTTAIRKVVKMPKIEDVEGVFYDYIVIDKKKVFVGLNVFVFMEEGRHAAYCAGLDIVGSGSTKAEAMEAFDTQVNLYIEYTTTKKSIVKDLARIGWKKDGKNRYVSPEYVPAELMKGNGVEEFEFVEFKKNAA